MESSFIVGFGFESIFKKWSRTPNYITTQFWSNEFWADLDLDFWDMVVSTRLELRLENDYKSQEGDLSRWDWMKLLATRLADGVSNLKAETVTPS